MNGVGLAFIISNSGTMELGGAAGTVAPHFTNLMLKQLHSKTLVDFPGEAYKLNAVFLSQAPHLEILFHRLCYLYQVKIHLCVSVYSNLSKPPSKFYDGQRQEFMFKMSQC